MRQLRWVYFFVKRFSGRQTTTIKSAKIFSKNAIHSLKVFFFFLATAQIKLTSIFYTVFINLILK